MQSIDLGFAPEVARHSYVFFGEIFFTKGVAQRSRVKGFSLTPVIDQAEPGSGRWKRPPRSFAIC